MTSGASEELQVISAIMVFSISLLEQHGKHLFASEGALEQFTKHITSSSREKTRFKDVAVFSLLNKLYGAGSAQPI